MLVNAVKDAIYWKLDGAPSGIKAKGTKLAVSSFHQWNGRTISVQSFRISEKYFKQHTLSKILRGPGRMGIMLGCHQLLLVFAILGWCFMGNSASGSLIHRRSLPLAGSCSSAQCHVCSRPCLRSNCSSYRCACCVCESLECALVAERGVARRRGMRFV